MKHIVQIRWSFDIPPADFMDVYLEENRGGSEEGVQRRCGVRTNVSHWNNKRNGLTFNNGSVFVRSDVQQFARTPPARFILVFWNSVQIDLVHSRTELGKVHFYRSSIISYCDSSFNDSLLNADFGHHSQSNVRFKVIRRCFRCTRVR